MPQQEQKQINMSSDMGSVPNPNRYKTHTFAKSGISPLSIPTLWTDRQKCIHMHTKLLTLYRQMQQENQKEKEPIVRVIWNSPAACWQWLFQTCKFVRFLAVLSMAL